MFQIKYLLMAVAALWLAGCAMHRPLPSVASACLSSFEQLDSQLASLGLHDAAAYRIPGYPYLRLTRFTASFSNEVDTVVKRQQWLSALRAEDLQARAMELRNLGRSGGVSIEVLDDCGQRLSAGLLKDDRAFSELLSRAKVPDDYSMTARVLGLYPFAVPFMKRGVQAYHQDVLADYAGALDVPEDAALMQWQPPSPGHRPESVFPYGVDALGVPRISENGWNRLLHDHAPVWQVEVASDDDLPGKVIMQEGPMVRPSEVVTYVQTGFARFEGQVLPQLIYVLWFPRRTAEAAVDYYAGEFDAVVWRVTLGADGEVLAYDTMHGCGCYQYFYPVNVKAKKLQGSWWKEAVLVPQSIVPGPPIILRLQAGTHYLRRVLSGDAMFAGAKAQGVYRMVNYNVLRSLPADDGRYRSLFSANGLLDGSERLERFWLWPSGVISPGAMRQLGRHATAFIGQRHFDDPYLMEEVFTR